MQNHHFIWSFEIVLEFSLLNLGFLRLNKYKNEFFWADPEMRKYNCFDACTNMIA